MRRTKEVSFDNSFSKSLNIRVISSLAFRSLGPSAKSVCILCFMKSDNAKFHKRKTAEGKPIFSLTVAEAKDLLGISNTTLSDCLKLLQEVGLIDCHKHGGLIGANGTASLYTLSKRWREWQPTKKHNGRNNIKIARRVLEEKQSASEEVLKIAVKNSS